MDLDRLAGQGVPGAFYMNKTLFTSVQEKAGDVIGAMTSQYYIGAVQDSSCDQPVQIIGFYPQSDFYVRPWVTEGTPAPFGEREIVVGSDIRKNVGDTLKLLGMDLTVAGKMEKTGTEMDDSVYAAGDTLLLLDEAASEQGLEGAAGHSSESELSCIYLKAADGYTAEEVNNTINIYVRKVQSTAARAMIAGISDSLSGISGLLFAALAVLGILSILILVIVFRSTANARKKEFSILRIMGVSGGKLAAMNGLEALYLRAAGGLLGLVPGFGVVSILTAMMESQMKLPRLLPGTGAMSLMGLAALLLVLLIGPAVSWLTVRKLCRMDAGTILRGE